MASPGRLRTQSRDRKILWSHAPESQAERHIILPDLQADELVFHEKLGQGGFSQVYRCSLGPIVYSVPSYMLHRLHSLSLI